MNYWKQRNARKKTVSLAHRNGNGTRRRVAVLDPVGQPAVTNAPPFRVTPTRRPHPPPAVVDSLHCVHARHGRQLGTATCAALPSKVRLRAAALRSPLRYTLRSVPPFRSRSPTLRPKRPRTNFSDCPQPPGP